MRSVFVIAMVFATPTIVQGRSLAPKRVVLLIAKVGVIQPDKQHKFLQKCRKDPRKKPVCFTCDQAVKILNAKDRLKVWPEKCKAKVSRARERDSLEFKRRLATKGNQLSTCEKKLKVALKAQKKNTWLAPMLIGVGIGLAVSAAVFLPMVIGK